MLKRKPTYNNGMSPYPKRNKDYLVHYLVVSTDRRSNTALIIPPANPNIPNTSELRRVPLQTKTAIFGELTNMTFSFQRPVQDVKSLNLVWFELTLNVNKLVEGTGNENLYKQLIKGVDITIYPSYGDFVKQIHHPYDSTHFHAEFKEIEVDRYQEQINLTNISGLRGGYTTRTTIEQTDSEGVRALKIHNQETLYRNFQTYNTLNDMYDWLIANSGVNSYQRNSAFGQNNFTTLEDAAAYDRIAEFASAELGGKYYTYNDSEVNAHGRIRIDEDATIDHPRTSERMSNIDARNATQLDNDGKSTIDRTIDNIFYEIDYNTYRQDPDNRNRKGLPNAWNDDKRSRLGRYYNKQDPIRGDDYVVYERIPNPNFNITTYNQAHAGLRGGSEEFYNGRYYTEEAENRVLEFTPNTNTVSNDVRAQINTFLIQNTKQFILNTQAREYINYLIGYRDRTDENIAVPPLETAGLSTTTTTTTTTGTVTPTTTPSLTIPDQIHTLSYYNTSSLIQTAKTAGNNIIPKLDFMRVRLSFPSLPVEDQQKLRRKLENNEVNAQYRIKLGACIEGYYRPGLSIEGVNR